jgi:hypothetical protein
VPERKLGPHMGLTLCSCSSLLGVVVPLHAYCCSFWCLVLLFLFMLTAAPFHACDWLFVFACNCSFLCLLLLFLCLLLLFFVHLLLLLIACSTTFTKTLNPKPYIHPTLVFTGECLVLYCRENSKYLPI